jgi:hypothetical protein
MQGSLPAGWLTFTGRKLNPLDRWYLASMRSIARRFEKATTADRIRLLRELERLAYQEMRRFRSPSRRRASLFERLRRSAIAVRDS